MRLMVLTSWGRHSSSRPGCARQVPDGYRMVVSAGPGGALRRALHPLRQRRPTWAWRYALDARGAVRLHLEEQQRPRYGACRPTAPAQAPAAEQPFSYVI